MGTAGLDGLGAAIPHRVGTAVMVVGLTSLTNPWKHVELNGKRGIVEAVDVVSGLHTVRLDGTGAQLLQLERAQCAPIPRFPSQQQGVSAAPTPLDPHPAAASAQPGMQAPPGMDPSLWMNILSVVTSKEDRSELIRVCNDHMAAATAATSTDPAAASTAAPSSPVATQKSPRAPAGTPNLSEMPQASPISPAQSASEMPQASPISPAPSAAPDAFPTPGLVFMAEETVRNASRGPQREKRAGELKHRGNKPANKNKDSRRQENAKRQKQQRKDKVAAVRAASVGAADPTTQAAVETSQTPATTHEEQASAAACSQGQSAVPTPTVVDPTQMSVQAAMSRPPTAVETAQSPVAPTPVVLSKPNSARREYTESIVGDEPPCASPVDQMKSVPERARSNSSAEKSGSEVSGPDAATTTTASPTPSRVEPNYEAGATNTAAGTTSGTSQHAAPTPISAQGTDDIAPTPAAATTPSAKKASPVSRLVRSSRTSKAASTATVSATAPPTPNMDAARSAEDTARAAAVRESKKAASAMRKEKELHKKQSQAVQRLRKANADADSEQVCGSSAMQRLASCGCGYYPPHTFT